MTYSESQAQQEVNDILSSIRQMISEEDSEGSKSSPLSSASSPSSSLEKTQDQILDLTRLVQEDGSVVELPKNNEASSLVFEKSDLNLEKPAVPSPSSSFPSLSTSPSLNLSQQENPTMKQNEEFDLNTFENQIYKADEQTSSTQRQSSPAHPSQMPLQPTSGASTSFPETAREAQPFCPEDSLLSAHTVQESAAAFAALSRATENRLSQENITPPTADTVGDYTVDTLMRELLKPLLKEWLDAHLPSLVKSLVLEQIEKVLQHPKPVAA